MMNLKLFRKPFDFAFVAIACLILFWIASCSEKTSNDPLNIKDGGFLSETPCGPPCFWGISPGISTSLEVKEMLETKEILSQCKIYDYSDDGQAIGIKCQVELEPGFNIGLSSLTSGMVDTIGIRPSFQITIQEVIEKYGEPDGVLIYPDGISEHPYTILVVVYSKIQTQLTLPRQEGTQYFLEPSTIITNIGYGLTYTDLKDEPFYEKWNGYGEY